MKIIEKNSNKKTKTRIEKFNLKKLLKKRIKIKLVGFKSIICKLDDFDDLGNLIVNNIEMNDINEGIIRGDAILSIIEI